MKLSAFHSPGEDLTEQLIQLGFSKVTQINKAMAFLTSKKSTMAATKFVVHRPWPGQTARTCLTR